ncbi:MAG TPA: ATP phosphoribosyltransferase regulatory subunit, partial [Gemmatimonadales bacterium]|nr:ATP phosphoribosyltransferase regulatory subunit [Gemmatimonadales bacterium]
MPARALPGFRDFYPDDAALRNHIFAAWRTVARRYGFEEYDGPPLEPRELYEQKSGAEIVEQLYWFEDKGGRNVALRPEMTPTLARMVTARAQGLKKPIRWFSLPQLFRYERQQRGRLREHFQLNMDLIGEPGPLADTEIIAAALDIMRALGLTERDVKVRLSDRRVVGALLAAAGVADDQLLTAFAALDKVERMPRDLLMAQLAEQWGGDTERAARVLDLARIKGADALRQALAGVPGGADAGEGLFECVQSLEAMGLRS